MLTSFAIYLAAVVFTLGALGIAAYVYYVHRKEFHKIRSYHQMIEAGQTLEGLTASCKLATEELKSRNDELLEADKKIHEKELCEEFLKQEADWPSRKKAMEGDISLLDISRKEYAEKAKQEQDRYAVEKGRIDGLLDEIKRLERLLEELKKKEVELPDLIKAQEDKLQELTKQIDALQGEDGEINKLTKEKEQLIQTNVKLGEQMTKLGEDIKNVEDDLTQKQGKIDEKDKVLDEKTALLEKLEHQVAEVEEKAKADAEEAAKQNQSTIDTQKKQITELNEEIARLEGRKKELNDRIKTVGKLPVEAFDSLRAPFILTYKSPESPEEADILKAVSDTTKARGYEIPERLQYAFHTSLKTADISCLTVMAGVSGTGKSAFPKIYADAVGMHFLPLAVEPRWDSPQDLFGFLNYMESRFEATTLGRSLMQFDNHPGSGSAFKNQMLLVMLDEMNLARIEYYFSEFLSKLEMRRGADLNEDFANLCVELYPGYKVKENEIETTVDPVRIFAGNNVLFVGTMNEDETTQSISDKVIDRANVLHLGQPAKLKKNSNGENHNLTKATPISHDCWKSWQKNQGANLDEVETRIHTFNITLGEIGRPFGHRAFQAMLSYIANHPYVALQRRDYKHPLADQVAMRIMPKLRGVGLNEYNEEFKSLETQISSLGDEALTTAFGEARNEKRGYFDWRGIDWDKK